MTQTLHNAVIRKERISDQIKSILKQSILDGEFKPGEKFPPEVEIAQKLKVSKVSAREALREMEAEGLIKKKRGAFGGNFIAEPGSEKMVDVVVNSYLFGGITATDLAEFRRILEPGLARLAAMRRTDKDLNAMEQCINDVEESIKNGRPDQTKAIGFHCLIADACHNRFISSLMEALVKVFQQVLAKTPDSKTATKDLKYNKLFLKYIRERDGEKAEIVMADHFDTLDEMIRKNNVD
ncbi:MAG: FadR family transcriptional regulator [Deltaproteobacteria bacterium]|uniref:FadR/GntR family transcriptional regulator n=1 Tax=Desulfobacula sp. TaxID=2593537 RepID=UPI0019A34642|nr:FadR family transcriptional regulator [Candidatus Desulfobacula maris]MBL6994326.1 FadR family transcriptional regulator [Desulfobacula sp.]